jgi:hypothetical protein
MKHARRLRSLARIAATVTTFDEPWRRVPAQYWPAQDRLLDAIERTMEDMADVVYRRVQLGREGVAQEEVFRRLPFPPEPNYPGIERDRELVEKWRGELGPAPEPREISTQELADSLRRAFVRKQRRDRGQPIDYDEEDEE